MAGVVPVLVLAGALGGCAASSRHPAEIGGFGDVQTGQASFYADRFEGRLTASGETFRQDLLTAAHRTLPFGTRVRVTNLVNRRAVVVRINDRGPFVEGRIIDLSRRAAEELDFVRAGLTDVKIEVLAGS
ncbi:septal ring lytic transglycosylase RlpA family protein [bacterium]|nr:septal ring lytic transglycosylase RlpA family protein [bacterium]